MELHGDKHENSEKIKKVKEEFDFAGARLEKLSEILSRRRDGVELKEVIESEGTNRIKEIFKTESDRLKSDKDELNLKILELGKALREIEPRNKVSEVKSRYKKHVLKFGGDLQMELDNRKTDRIDGSSLKTTGSRTPRALLAYYFAIIECIRYADVCAFAPLIIDSPNQQALDGINLQEIYDFIVENQPLDSQIILGTEDIHDTKFTGTTIKLTRKKSVLLEEEYDEIREFCAPLITDSLRDGDQYELIF